MLQQFTQFVELFFELVFFYLLFFDTFQGFIQYTVEGFESFISMKSL